MLYKGQWITISGNVDGMMKINCTRQDTCEKTTRRERKKEIERM